MAKDVSALMRKEHYDEPLRPMAGSRLTPALQLWDTSIAFRAAHSPHPRPIFTLNVQILKPLLSPVFFILTHQKNSLNASCLYQESVKIRLQTK